MKQKKIRIVKIQDREEGVPDWVLDAWRGLELTYHCVKGKRELTDNLFNMVTGKKCSPKERCYFVKATDALESLRLKDEKAYRWYEQNSDMFFKIRTQPDWGFVFYFSRCERIY